MKVIGINVTPIDPNHDMVKVYYSAEYEKKSKDKPDREDPVIDFDVTYLLESHQDQAKIFAFVAGDEMKAYKDKGLL